jgi:hypothetical protein
VLFSIVGASHENENPSRYFGRSPPDKYSGGNPRNPEFVAKLLALSSLTRSGFPQNYQSHKFALIGRLADNVIRKITERLAKLCKIFFVDLNFYTDFKYDCGFTNYIYLLIFGQFMIKNHSFLSTSIVDELSFSHLRSL